MNPKDSLTQLDQAMLRSFSEELYQKYPKFDLAETNQAQQNFYRPLQKPTTTQPTRNSILLLCSL